MVTGILVLLTSLVTLYYLVVILTLLKLQILIHFLLLLTTTGISLLEVSHGEEHGINQQTITLEMQLQETATPIFVYLPQIIIHLKQIILVLTGILLLKVLNQMF